MLKEEPWRYALSELDQRVFRSCIPPDHPLVRALGAIDWNRFEEILHQRYSAHEGQPAIKPVLLLKLEYLRYVYNLSDHQVIERAETDVAIRYFLQVGLDFRLPDPSTLSRFRGRLGAEGFHQVFQTIIAMARGAGLVKDRLRLKDASHVIANIAVPTTLGLLGQIRDRLLAAAAVFDPETAEGHRINAGLIRDRTRTLEMSERLDARATHLREMVAWTEGLPRPEGTEPEKAWNRLLKLRELARKILADQADPTSGRRTLSVVDPEARRGKHGDWYDGYVLDILMDADSELITEMNVLEAGGDEAKDAIQLVRQEESAQGNDIAAISIDGAGFNGPMLREFEDPNGLAVTPFVPPKPNASEALFPATDFRLAPDRSHVRCPAGQPSQYRQRDERKRSSIFRFTRKQCDACPLVRRCMAHPGQGAFGKTVSKNDYEAEYCRARERSQTEEFGQVRKQHPAIERKLNEVLRHHGGRRARYRGRTKVACQQYMTCFAVNLKRLVAILFAKRQFCS